MKKIFRLFDSCRRFVLAAVVLGVATAAVFALQHSIGRVVDIYCEQGLSGVYRKVTKQPSIVWETATAGTVDIDEERLDQLRCDLVAKNTQVFVVVRRNRIVCEWYAQEPGHWCLFDLAAIPKSVIASLLLAVALDEGWVELDDPVSQYIPQWKNDPIRSKITIRQLASHSSGLDDVDFQNLVPGWKTDYVENRRSRFSYALNRIDLLYEPGSRYSYSGVGFYVLSYALTARLRDTPYRDLRSVLEERVMLPIGIHADDWKGYDGPHDIDGMTLYAIGSGWVYSARAVARIGQLVVNEGQWDGKSLIGREHIRAITSYAESPRERGRTPSEPAAGLGWWINDELYWPSLPRDAIVGIGSGHQLLLVVPSLELVVVRQGKSLTGRGVFGEPFWRELEEHIFKPLMATIRVTASVGP